MNWVFRNNFFPRNNIFPTLLEHLMKLAKMS